MTEQLFLCFNGDGPYWSDFVISISYPSEFSYSVYPFRYDSRLVVPSLQSELTSQEGAKKIVGTEAILGARFTSSHADLICPIRKVTVTHLDIAAGLFLFYFRCGPLLDVQSASALSQVSIKIPAATMASLASHLCFRAPLPLPIFLPPDPRLEEQVWAKFCQLIAAESVLPIKEDAKRSLFLRFRAPMRGEKMVPIECLHNLQGQGPIYGAAFREGQTYEVTYSHRVPWLEGKNTTIAEIPLDYMLPTSSVELSSPTGTVIGNYQVTNLSLTGIRASSSWEEMVIQPKERILTAQNQDKINAFEMKIPFKVKRSLWYRFRTSWVYVLLLWLALAAVGAIAAVADIVKDISAGKPVGWGLYKYYLPLAALFSGMAALSVFLLQEKVKKRMGS